MDRISNMPGEYLAEGFQAFDFIVISEDKYVFKEKKKYIFMTAHELSKCLQLIK